MFNYELLKGQNIFVCIIVPCVEKNHSGSTNLLFAMTTLLYLYFPMLSAETIEKVLTFICTDLNFLLTCWQMFLAGGGGGGEGGGGGRAGSIWRG